MRAVAARGLATKVRRVCCVALSVLLAGCPTHSVIRRPPAVFQGNPSTVGNPVLIELDWGGVQHRIGDPYVQLDGNSVTANFGANIQCCQSASATFTLAPGPHSVTVGVPRSATLGTYIESLPFNVVDPSFALTLSPATLAFAPGGSATVTVTVTPSFGYNGAVTISVTGLPPGVSSVLTSPTTIALSAMPTAPGGAATATVTGTGPCSPGCGGPATSTASAALGVTVTAPGFSIASVNPPSAVIPRGGSVPVNVTLTRTGGFNGAVNITAANLPNGVSAPLTPIPAGANSGSITLTATTSAGLADVAAGTASTPPQVTLNLTGVCMPACPGMTGSQNISARVGRRLGQFAVHTTMIKNAPGTAASADNAVGLTYAPANPQPPGPMLFTATYNRVAAPGTTLSAINLEQSISTYWGAAFCAASPTIAGVVLSGTYASQTNAPLFYELPIWAPAPATTAARAVFLPLYYQNASVGAGTTIVPRLWFSPDCTLAAYVQSSFAPSPPAGLTIIDMRTGQPIATALLYAGASPSRLEVKNQGAGQVVEVQFSPNDVRTVQIPQ